MSNDVAHVAASRGARSEGNALLLTLARGLGSTAASVRHLPGGQPTIEGFAVSKSYTSGLVTVAVSRTGPLGIDVEMPRRVNGEAIARRRFAPREADAVAEASDPAAVFLQLWTAKEAVGKALGSGLRDGGLARNLLDVDGLVLTIAGISVRHFELRSGALLAVACTPQTRIVVTDKT